MKKSNLVIVLIALLLSGNAFAQSYSILNFRKPTTSDNINFRFTHVISGVDAIVSVVGTKNATLSNIDDSSIYRNAWNPFITFGRANNSTDSSYITFRISFVKNNNNSNAHSVPRFAMTAVDLDGNGIGSYREMYAVPSSSTPRGIIGSTISKVTSSLFNTFISSTLTFSNIDTTNFIAMSQNDFTNTSSYTMRVGIVGRQSSSSTTRQFSFYFKPFNPLNIVLPVEMIDLQASVKNSTNTVSWKTTSEKNTNHFEIYRSNDGINYEVVGLVEAIGNSTAVQSYEYADLSAEAGVASFYKIKVVDNDGSASWTHALYIAAKGNSVAGINSIYPNPCNDILNVNLNTVSEGDITVEVVDAFGKVLNSTSGDEINGMSSVSFDLSNLSTGVYFVKVTNNNGQSEMSKFVKK